MRVPHILSICGLLVTAPVFAQRTKGRHEPARHSFRTDVVGCYAFFAGTGKRIDADYYHASPLVRLDSAMHPAFADDPVPGAHRLLIRLDTAGHRLDPIDPRPRLGPMWWADSLSDSINVSFTTGFSGAFLVLAASPQVDTLRGYIEDHWDFSDPTGRDKAYAVRVPCVE